jgi:hypothetical protein
VRRGALVRRPVTPERRVPIEEAVLPDVTRDELVEIVRYILADPTDDWYIASTPRWPTARSPCERG